MGKGKVKFEGKSQFLNFLMLLKYIWAHKCTFGIH